MPKIIEIFNKGKNIEKIENQIENIFELENELYCFALPLVESSVFVNPHFIQKSREDWAEKEN